MGYIYLAINKINNKKYVGQTTLTIQERWDRHVYEALNEYNDFYFHRAIRKYSPDNFTIKQVCECDNNELDEKEIYFIDFYKSYYIYKEGYNLTRGGSGGTKVNEKEVMKYWNQGASAIEIARMFNFYIGTVTKVLKRYEVPQSEIYSRSQKYGQKYRQKKIFQYDKEGNLLNIYENLDDMHEQTGYSRGYISAACCHKYSSANGYLWIYETDETSIQELLNKIPVDQKHPVLQYSQDGHFIKEYISHAEAYRDLGLDKTSIGKVVNNTNRTAGGYIWMDKPQDGIIQQQIEIIPYDKYQNNKRRIVQYDLENNFINSYESITAAAEAINKPSSRSAIGKVCQGKQKTSCGYIWKYEES